MMVNSNEQELTEDQILTIAAQETKSEYSPDMVKAFFEKEKKTKGFKSYRYGNTIYSVHPSKSDPSKGMFRALNADTAENYVASGFKFITDAYNDGYDILVTEFKDETILNIFRTVSKNPPNPGMGYSTSKLENGDFRVTIKLGTPRNKGAQ
jgi:hypothetical protein